MTRRVQAYRIDPQYPEPPTVTIGQGPSLIGPALMIASGFFFLFGFALGVVLEIWR